MRLLFISVNEYLSHNSPGDQKQPDQRSCLDRFIQNKTNKDQGEERHSINEVADQRC